jgi:hypothetical protein
MGERPKCLTLERQRNNEGYNPDNCIWATPKTQALNRRSTRYITAWGITKPLEVWAEQNNINPVTIHSRLKRGWSPEEAIAIQPRAYKKLK